MLGLRVGLQVGLGCVARAWDVAVLNVYDIAAII